MSDSINGAGNTVINNYYGSEPDDATESMGDTSSSGSDIADVLAEYAKEAAADGEISKNEADVLKALAGAASAETEGGEESEGGDSETEGSSDLTPQDFMSQLNDIADESKGLSDGERKMLDEGQRMINATPEQQQAFLDKAKSLAEDSGEIGDEEAAELAGFADGLMHDASDGSTGSDEAEEKPFMDQVEDLLAQSQDGDEGPGEKMAREAAKLLEDNPEVDQQAFLDELDKMLNNTDGNGDYEKDIDETNDGEGTMLKNMAEAFDDLPSDRSTDASDSYGSDSTSGSNTAVRDFLNEITSDGDMSDSEITALRALIEATESEDAEATAAA